MGDQQKILRQMYEQEALADFMIKKYSEIKNKCRKAIQEMEGVSTPSIKKVSYKLDAEMKIVRRRALINEKAASGN